MSGVPIQTCILHQGLKANDLQEVHVQLSLSCLHQVDMQHESPNSGHRTHRSCTQKCTQCLPFQSCRLFPRRWDNKIVLPPPSEIREPDSFFIPQHLRGRAGWELTTEAKYEMRDWYQERRKAFPVKFREFAAILVVGPSHGGNCHLRFDHVVDLPSFQLLLFSSRLQAIHTAAWFIFPDDATQHTRPDNSEHRTNNPADDMADRAPIRSISIIEVHPINRDPPAPSYTQARMHQPTTHRGDAPSNLPVGYHSRGPPASTITGGIHTVYPQTWPTAHRQPSRETPPHVMGFLIPD